MGHCIHDVWKAHIPCVMRLKTDDIVKSDDKCGGCGIGKFKRQPWKSSDTEAGSPKPAGEVYTNLVGPIKTKSQGKSRYFITLMETYSGFSLARFLSKKNETANAVINMVKELESLVDCRIGTLECVERMTVKWARSDGDRK